MSANGLEASSDSEEDDWEEVEVPEEEKHLEITISTRPKQEKKSRLTSSERTHRVNSHKLHTLALLTNAWVRNRWINDPLLHARLLSLTPLSLQTAFAMIHKSRVPEQHRRGRMFETAMGHLAFWWAKTFFDVTFEGHLRNRTFESVHSAMELRELIPYPASEPWDVELLQEVLDDEGEVIRSPKSLMKHALMQKGSRDTSAQLFTALCRGLGIPARLVVSLQSVPWKSNVGKPKPDYRKGKAKAEDPAEDVVPDPKAKGKGKAKAKPTFAGNGQRLDGSVPEKSEKAKGKEKAKPAIKLRKTKGNVLGSGASTSTLPRDPITTPPVFWTEVFSRPDARWLPVDPVRGLVNQAYMFDPSAAPDAPTPTSNAMANPDSAAPKRALDDNRMVYVLAFEEDGYGRDVTRRYARNFATTVAKLQGGQKQRGRTAWWERVLEGIQRPYRLHRDDVEDAELDTAQLLEGMPTTIGGFKDHPMYVLERHLTQMQTLHPPPPQTRELGKFRGESVYPRSAVVSLKTAENWMRSEGRRVKEGEQPMKMTKMRASTIGRLREVEVMREGLRVAGEQAEARAAADGDDDAPGGSSTKQKGKGKEWEKEEVMQGLYALSQTELYIPYPVVDGKIPKNNFGNIDLYVPSMLPAGAVHIPYKGTAKIAKKLGFNYAEAVTGFEFKNRNATPIMKGIVVAAENEGAMLEAYWEAENDAAEKARAKRRERVLKRWTRLVHGLRIRQQLQDEYKDRQPAVTAEKGQDVEVLPGLAGGGFVTGADDVVQAYHLPKYQHVNLPFLPSSGANSGAQSDSEVVPENLTYDFETMDVDEDPGVEDEQPNPRDEVNAPKTMQQLAEETAARLRKEFARDNIEDAGEEVDPPPPRPTASASKAKKPGQAKPSRVPSARNATKTKAKVGAPAARRASARKRRRTDSDSEEGGEETEPSTAKRVKGDNGVAAPPTGRSLRPRRSKTQTEVQEEEERERAFRRAVAK
ncbi:hypothetical protein DFH07DRAFT_757131 [Mycena maculata]|uniref:Rad4-domain-containing protein n=1 Tax=Mycena maculata TaxID=230809 RepID=A0AAD7MSI1_9AGAR|nr:hypothetical protein DFH07DRAFT_757131 [Mycena maculata]